MPPTDPAASCGLCALAAAGGAGVSALRHDNLCPVAEAALHFAVNDPVRVSDALTALFEAGSPRLGAPGLSCRRSGARATGSP